METFLLGESRRLFPLPAQQGEGGERPTREPGEGQTPCVDQNKQKFGSSGDFRQQATNAETKLWLALRDRRLSGFKFVRQAAILKFAARLSTTILNLRRPMVHFPSARNGSTTCATASGNSSCRPSLPCGRQALRMPGSAISASISARER